MLISFQEAKLWGIFKTWCNMQVWWKRFFHYPHSIINKRPFGPGSSWIFEHPQREFEESKLLEFSQDNWVWWGGNCDIFWWSMVRILHGSGWWRALFLNHSSFCWLFICWGKFNMLIIFCSGLIVHCHLPSDSFLHCSWLHLDFVPISR